MPFVTLEQIQPFINESLYAKLQDATDDGATFFDKVEAEAGEFVSREIGIKTPSDVSLAPSYIKRPMAKIIQKFSVDLIDEIANESEFYEKADAEFREAVEFLKKQTEADASDGTIGEIEGVEQW